MDFRNDPNSNVIFIANQATQIKNNIACHVYEDSMNANTYTGPGIEYI